MELSVNDNSTVLLSDDGDHANNAYDITKLTFKDGTLYVDDNATLGFAVSPDAKILLALAGKDGDGAGEDWFDDVDVYTGYSGLEKAIRDMNATINSTSFAAGTVEIGAILENGVATSIVINDMNAKTGFNPTTPTYDFTPVVNQDGTFLKIQANTDDGDGMIVYTAAWNWLVNNGYSVVSADQYAAGSNNWEDGWTFFVSKDGQSTFFKTELTVMQKVMINGKADYLEMGTEIGSNSTDDYKVAGDYMWANTSGTFNHTGARSATSTITLSWTTHGNNLMVVDGLYKVTVSSDGTGTGTDYYYQMGDSMDDELSGNWYALGAAPTAATATSTTGVKMSNALKNQTIWDNYYKVTVNDGSDTETLYVLNGSDATFTTASFSANQYLYDSLNNEYVKVTTANKINGVAKDMQINDMGYYMMKSVVAVTDSTSGKMGTMRLTADVVGAQYIKLNGSVTVKLTLESNGDKSTGVVSGKLAANASAGIDTDPDIDSAAAQIIAATASVIDSGKDTYTVKLTAAPTGDADVTLTLTLT